MPPIPIANQQPSGSVSVSFMGGGGGLSSISFDTNVQAAGNQLPNIFTALGNLSNAAIYKQGSSTSVEVAKTLVTPFDESYSNVETKAIMTYQNATLDILKIAIPAPDASIFGGDGKTVDRTNFQVINFNNLFLAYINDTTPVGTWAFLQGSYTTTTRSRKAQKYVPPIAEPTAGQLPPPAPGA